MQTVYIVIIIFLLISLGFSYYFLFPSLYSKNLRLNDREYLLHLPSNYQHNQTQKIPLVIALHAYTDHPRIMELYSGWSRKANHKNFIVVYPKGTNSEKYPKLSWNADFCCGGAPDNNVDDVKFISELIDELAKTYPVDAQQVYITGFSNGGMLAYKLANEIPEKIAAIGVVSTSPAGKLPDEKDYREFSPASKKIRTIMLHGILDESVPFAGGLNTYKDRDFRAFEETEKIWQDSYQCEFDIQEVDLKAEIVTTRKYFCDDALLMQSIIFKKSMHVWFGGLLEWKNILSGNTLSATDLIWEFFEKNKS